MWNFRVVGVINSITGSEKMSGTKVAMPQPNSFQSGALSFMSCTSGRESSPLDDNDSHPTTEFKTETKKKRFHPLRNLRRMFRRKSRRSSISAESYQPGGLKTPETTPTNLDHRSCSTSRLQEENLVQNLIRNSRLNPGLSLSHDSIFTPDRADSGLSSSDLENSSLSITVLTPPSRECPIKSQSSCSETSLLSIGSSEVELSPVKSGKISDLDLRVTTYKLSHSAAKHKMAVKPKRNHGAPRNRRRTLTSKSPLPITIEVSEEGATGRNSPSAETPTSESSSSKNSKRVQDAKISWSDIALDSLAKEPEEKANDHIKLEDELDSKEEEVNTQRSESFFGRFLSRRSDKKKKSLQESNADNINEEKSSGKKVEGKAGATRKSPNRRQRVEPVEIPTSVNKIDNEEEVFVAKKISSSVSPPKNFWANQVTSRSMSPPKVVWPENTTVKSQEPMDWDKAKADMSPSKQSTENVLKDWKNPNFVKELSDSVGLFAREKSGKTEKDEPTTEKEKEKEVEDEEFAFKVRRQHSDDTARQKTSNRVDNVTVSLNKSNFSGSVESVKHSDVENSYKDSVVAHTEPVCTKIQPRNFTSISYEEIHDGYENIQIIEQVKQEIKKSEEAQPSSPETKVVVSVPETPVDSVKKETDTRNQETEVVKRVKPAILEKPKDLKKMLPESAKPNTNDNDHKCVEDSKNSSKTTRNNLVERRKSELLLLTETEEKEWKAKVKPLKKQTSFSGSSPDKTNETSPKSPALEKSFTEKTESSPEVVEEVVVFRKKSVTSTSDEQPELMKVFARRSLKVKESEKIAEEMQRSRDSDKENEVVGSPENRKKTENVEEKREKDIMSTRSVGKVKISESKVNTPNKPEVASRNGVLQKYARSLSENNAKPKEVELKRESSVLEETSPNSLETTMEKASVNKLKKEGIEKEVGDEEETGFKRIQQRKAEWERRAQQGAK